MLPTNESDYRSEREVYPGRYYPQTREELLAFDAIDPMTEVDDTPSCQEERFIRVVISSRNESGVARQFAPGQWVVVTDSVVFTTSSEKASLNMRAVRNRQGQALLATDSEVAHAESKISRHFGG